MKSGKEYQAEREELENELVSAKRSEKSDQDIEKIEKEIRDFDKEHLTGQTKIYAIEKINAEEVESGDTIMIKRFDGTNPYPENVYVTVKRILRIGKEIGIVTPENETIWFKNDEKVSSRI